MLTVAVQSAVDADVNWGSVPDWIAAVGTAGALLLGFYILLRDRRRDESAQARMVSCRLVRSSGPGASRVTAILHNGSGLPITLPELVGCPKPVRELRDDESRRQLQAFIAAREDDGPIADHVNKFGRLNNIRMPFIPFAEVVLQPGEQRRLGDDLIVNPDWYRWYFEFLDAQGQAWRRDSWTDRLTRHRGG